MTLELWTLLGSAAILWIAIFAQQLVLDITGGVQYALSNREQDHNFKGVTPLHGRLTRTVRNHMESLAIFTPLILIAAVAGISNIWTKGAAITFMISRALYLLFYAAGITPFRSFAWMIGFMFSVGAFVFGLVMG